VEAKDRREREQPSHIQHKWFFWKADMGVWSECWNSWRAWTSGRGSPEFYQKPLWGQAQLWPSLAISGTNSMYQLLTTTTIFFLATDIIWWVSSFLQYLYIYIYIYIFIYLLWRLRSNKKKKVLGDSENSFIDSVQDWMNQPS